MLSFISFTERSLLRWLLTELSSVTIEVVSLGVCLAKGAETTRENIRLLAPNILPVLPLGSLPLADPGVDPEGLSLMGIRSPPMGVKGCAIDEEEDEASVSGMIRAEDADEEFD